MANWYFNDQKINLSATRTLMHDLTLMKSKIMNNFQFNYQFKPTNLTD